MELGNKEKASFDEVLEQFSEPDMRYAPYQFWFWDQRLKTLGIKPEDMARELFEKGFNPGYAHARTNYAQDFTGGGKGVAAISRDEWLSDEWFDVLEKVMQQAKSDGSFFSVADEYGWPSLQAGGRVLEKYPDMRSKSLHYKILDVRGGETAELPEADFTVYAKLIRTENTSYVEFTGQDWKRESFSWDQSQPCQTETLPYNGAAKCSENTDAKAVFHPYFSHGGRYRLYAWWCDCRDNSDCVKYTVKNGTYKKEILADQRSDLLQWNLLGSFTADAGDRMTIEVSNAGSGTMCVDAIRLENEQDRNDYIVIDDCYTYNRKIGVIDAQTLTVLSDEKKAIRWTAPAGNEIYRIYSFSKVVQRGYDGSLVNNLDKRLGERFTEIAYRPYFERLGSFIGSEGPMNGIFADTEGGYGFQLAWSEDLEKRFQQKTGEDLRRALPLMMDVDENGLDAKIRFEWYDAVSELFTENFSVPIQYAGEHDIYYTMHTWEESLPFQANTVGDYFKLNRAVTLPGTDCLCSTAYNPANFWDTMSIAEFGGKRYMTEMMALERLQKYNMAELKKQANYLAAWGVSHVITHALKMTRARAQEVVTPDFFNVDPGWRNMKYWTDYVRRISYVNSNGFLKADVLLVNPMDSIWELSDGANMDPAYDQWDVGGGVPANTASHGGKASEINRIYQETIRQLVHARVESMSADKHFIREMTLQGACLVHGTHVFRTVILPPMTVMDLMAAQILLRFAQAGGRIIYLGELPTGSLQKGRLDKEMQALMEAMRSLPNVCEIQDLQKALEKGIEGLKPRVSFIEGDFNILSLCREIDGKLFVWLANNEEEMHECIIQIASIYGRVSLWNPEDGSIAEIPACAGKDGMEIPLRMHPFEGFFLVVDSAEEPNAIVGKRSEEVIAVLDSGWTAKINTGNVRTELEHCFESVCSDRIRLVLRKGSFHNCQFACISRIQILNGQDEITDGAQVQASSGNDAGFVLVDDSQSFWQNSVPMELDESQFIEIQLPEKRRFDKIMIRTQENEPIRSYRLEYWDGNWWRNLTTFHECWESELIRPISYPKDMLDNPVPVRLTDWRKWKKLDEHFSGSIDYEWIGKLPKYDGEVYLSLGTVGQIAEVWVNGKSAGVRISQPYDVRVTGMLRQGKNHIMIRVSNAIASNAGALEKACGLLGPVCVKVLTS